MRRVRARRIVWFIALSSMVGVPAHSQAPVQPPGEKYALLVGVRKYAKSSELRELHYAERDMDELAQVLRDGGYRPENLVLMTQTLGAENTRFLPLAANIRKELTALLRDRIETDSVLIAFAGHGLQFRGSAETYFCPADGRPDDKGTLLSLQEVYQELAGCEARFKLLLSDACRNDPIAAVSRRTSVNLASVTRPQLQRPPGGVAALFSCSEGELAYENDTLKHGVFFHFVIEGLRGAADFDKDGQIGLEELTFFAKRRVLDYVRAEYDGVRQMPVLKGEVGGLPVLVSLDRPKIPDRPLPRPIAPREEEKTIANSIGMKLALIPAGEFLMGSTDADKDAFDNEKPQHRVRITQPFYLGVYEVTQQEYETVMGRNPSFFSATGKSKDRVAGRVTRRYPVEDVSWNDAIEFCNKLSEREGLRPYYRFGAGEQSGGDGYRLPTEAEWEYACRAGSTTRYSFGDDAGSLGEFAWYGDNQNDNQTHPVGQKRPNAFGLYDMLGNVWEWCWDGYEERYYANSPPDDPLAPSQAADRVSRGGGWGNDPRDCRSAGRGGNAPDSRDYDLGFRVARVQSGR